MAERRPATDDEAGVARERVLRKEIRRLRDRIDELESGESELESEE